MSSEDKEIVGLCDKLNSEHLDEEPTSSQNVPTQLQEMEGGDKSGTSETATPSSGADSGDKSGTSETATPSSGADSSGRQGDKLRPVSYEDILMIEPTAKEGVFIVRDCNPDELEHARSQAKTLDEDSIILRDRIAVEVKSEAGASNQSLNSRLTEREESSVSTGSNVSSCGKSSDGKSSHCLLDRGAECEYCEKDKSACKICDLCDLDRRYVQAMFAIKHGVD